MSQTIWKYALDGTVTERDMPFMAYIVYADMQGGFPTLWAMVDSDLPLEKRIFHIVGTGSVFPAGEIDYIGTVMDGPFVWHIVEERS